MIKGVDPEHRNEVVRLDNEKWDGIQMIWWGGVQRGEEDAREIWALLATRDSVSRRK